MVGKWFSAQAWFLDSARSKRRAWIFVACPQSCAVCLGWKFQGEEIPKETEDWREMGPWLISSHIGQGKQGHGLAEKGRSFLVWKFCWGNPGLFVSYFPADSDSHQVPWVALAVGLQLARVGWQL